MSDIELTAIDRVECWACDDRGACPYCPIEWEGCPDCEGTGHCQECDDEDDDSDLDW